MKQSVDEIYLHYKRFMDTKDLDKNTADTMIQIFKDNDDDTYD